MAFYDLLTRATLLLDAQRLGVRVYRLWVFERLLRILLAPTPPTGQLVTILGQGGCGKSTLMATLTRNGTQRRPESDHDGWKYLPILGCHYCMAGTSQTLSARAFVDGFAASLVCSPYTKAFKQRAIDRPIEVLRACDAADASVVFRGLLRLCAKLASPTQRRVAYIVDGLDESAAASEPGQHSIATLVLRCAKEAPPWLVFVVTSKSEMHTNMGALSRSTATPTTGRAHQPSPNGEACLSGGATLPLAFPGFTAFVPIQCVINLDDSSRSAADVAEYIHERLRLSPQLVSFGGTAAEQLAEASGGNFQFARSVIDLASEQSWSPEQVRELVAYGVAPEGRSVSPNGRSRSPGGSAGGNGSANGSGLAGCSPGGSSVGAHVGRPVGLLDRLYVGLFSAQFYERFAEVQPLLELLLAARRHLTHDEIAAALRLHYPNVRVGVALQELKPYLTMHEGIRVPLASENGMLPTASPGRIALQHLSLRTWLTDEKCNRRFLCSLARGHGLMASHHLAAAHNLALTLWFEEHQRASSSDADGGSAWRPAAGGGARQHKVASSQRVFHVAEAAMHLGQIHEIRTGSGPCSGTDGAGSSHEDRSALPGLSAALSELVSAPALALGPGGLTAIHTATKRANQPEYLRALEVLLQATAYGGGGRSVRGCDRAPCAVLARSHHGKTPLEHAAARGLGRALALLLTAADDAIASGGATRDEVERAADAALWAATSAGGSGGLSCIESLLQWGAAKALPASGFESRVSLVIQRGILLGTAASGDIPKGISPCPLSNAAGQTALFYAAKDGMYDAARALLRAPPLAEVTSPMDVEWAATWHYVDLGVVEIGCAASSSPLYVAVSRGDTEMAALLLVNGADPALVGQHRRTDYWPRTPLGKACALGNLASVRTILSTPSGALTINLAPAPPPARPALLEAVWAIHLECVDAMLGHADIDTLCAEADGACALHEAAYWGKGRASVVPAEHQAASALLVTMLRHHAARGLSVDPRDSDGCSPLCFACASNGDQAGWVKLLLDARASPSVRPMGGFSAHGWRASIDEQAAREASRGHDALFSVTSPGAQPWGGTPIEEAASRGHTAVVATLLAAAAARTPRGDVQAGGADGDAHAHLPAALMEAATRLVACAAEAAADGSDAPLRAEDITTAGCTTAMAALLLPPPPPPLTPGAVDGKCLRNEGEGVAVEADVPPRFAERVHDDAPLAPPPTGLAAYQAAARVARSPKTPPAIGPLGAGAALRPDEFTL